VSEKKRKLKIDGGYRPVSRARVNDRTSPSILFAERRGVTLGCYDGIAAASQYESFVGYLSNFEEDVFISYAHNDDDIVLRPDFETSG